MCGLAGFLTADASAPGSPEAVATRMALAIQHRGPDDAGAWTDEQAGIALSHRRLSILDLSSAGHQPMHSTCPSAVPRGEVEAWQREGDIEYLGQSDDMVPVYGEADCVVLPSYREGMSKTPSGRSNASRSRAVGVTGSL